MNADWEKLCAVFDEACDLDAGARNELLARRCAGDVALRTAVDRMLRAYDAEQQAQIAARIRHETRKRRFGAWETVELLARGGMAEVWLARRADGQHEQRAALKVISPFLVTPEYVERFRRETQLLARLEHPNIARLFDSGVTGDGEPYLVMEFVDGLPLDEYCERNHVNVDKRVHLICSLCSAVESAHSSLILHRDIKPSNVLVTGNGVVKLLDFGAAREMDSELDATQLKTTPPMTPAYASPEQLGQEMVTTLSDIWALGAILYRVLAGTPPFGPARYPYQTMRRMETDEVQPPSQAAGLPSEVRKRIRGDLDNIVLMATAREPRRRYTSVEALRADLENFLASRPIRARPITWRYRAERFVARHRVSVAFAALLILSLVSGIALVAREAKIATQQRIRAEKRFNDVRQLAHTFLFDFHDAIRDLPGATPVRRLVVQKALVYLNSLSQESGQDPALEHELVEAYLRVADVQGSPGVPNLGDAAGALDSYGRALAIAESWSRRHPQDSDWQRYLERAHSGLGDVLAARNDAASALPHYREAVHIVEKVGPPSTQDVASQFDMLNAYLALGDCLGNPGFPNVGDPQGAKAAYEKARNINLAIAAAHPDNRRAQRSLALIEMRMGDVEMGFGNAADGLMSYQNAAKLAEEALAKDPLNPSTLFILGNVTGKVGSALDASGQSSSALVQYQRASDIGYRLVIADPQNQQSKNSYALGLRRRADLLAKMGKTQAALKLDREALEIFRQVLAGDSEGARHRVIYAQTLADIGKLTAKRSKAEAVRPYSEAMSIFASLAARGTATAEDLSSYAEDLLTCPLAEFADLHEALAVSKRAVELSHASQPEYLEQLARAYWATGDAPEAAATERKAAALWSEPTPRRRGAQALLAKFELAALQQRHR